MNELFGLSGVCFYYNASYHSATLNEPVQSITWLQLPRSFELVRSCNQSRSIPSNVRGNG